MGVLESPTSDALSLDDRVTKPIQIQVAKQEENCEEARSKKKDLEITNCDLPPSHLEPPRIILQSPAISFGASLDQALQDVVMEETGDPNREAREQHPRLGKKMSRWEEMVAAETSKRSERSAGGERLQ